MLKNLLKSLLVGVMVVFCALPAFADNPCKNLFDSSVFNTNVGNANTFVSYQIPNGTYTMSTNFPAQTNTVYTNVWVLPGKVTTGIDSNINGVSFEYPRTFTVTDGWFTVCYRSTHNNITRDPKDYNWQLEAGSTATPYTPYNAGCNNTCQNGEMLQTYTTATGTVTQNGTPTPTNPITPTFYTQGNMVLRKVGAYADSYDATTGKITRRVGVRVLTGNENISYDHAYRNFAIPLVSGMGMLSAQYNTVKIVSTHFKQVGYNPTNVDGVGYIYYNQVFLRYQEYDNDLPGFKQWLSQQYAAGTPVTVYYPLETPVEETWTGGTSYCAPAIKIATTAYNNNAFSSVQTALNNAVDTIKTVVANTITQAAAVQSLQAGKQTMPDASDTDGTCPRFRQCLLIQDPTGKPHWYPILDPVRDFVTPILATEANSGAGNDRYDKGDPELCAIADNCTNVRNEQFSTQTGIYRLLKDREWAVPWVGTEADGIVPGVAYGESRCVYNITGVSVAEPNTEAWTIIETANAANDIENKEQYSRCYCKFTEVGINNEIFPVLDDRPWVYNANLGTAAACASDCSRRCANRAVDNHSIRQNLFL